MRVIIMSLIFQSFKYIYIFTFSSPPFWMRLVLSFHSYSSSLINVCVGLVACCPVFNLSVSWVRVLIESLPLNGFVTESPEPAAAP